MMGLGLYDYQLDAIGKMKNGCVLCGGVGSGKSRTALGYYYQQNGIDIYGNDHRSSRLPHQIQDLYIITTARKRDSKDWELDMAPFLLSPDPKQDRFDHKIVIDSWNNIQKYKLVEGAFFIFDEQRVVGSGVWVKSFLKIAKNNNWILLSATPGDTWSDYIPVFIANGFYKNRTEFNNEHVVWSRFTQFPKIDRYLGTTKLNRLRNEILVDMDFHRHTQRHYEIIECDYDKMLYKSLTKTRWDPYDDCPIENGSKLYYLQRKVSNVSDDRQVKLLELLTEHKKAIIFYNYDYELEILRTILDAADIPYTEWNGHKHEPLPTGNRWAYLVQYAAGNEAWNCIETDTIIFFSQNPSYKVLEQASGRIDRLNTPFDDLYYYRLKSNSPIDVRMNMSLINKKNFNQRDLVRKYNERYFSQPAVPPEQKSEQLTLGIESDPLPESFFKKPKTKGYTVNDSVQQILNNWDDFEDDTVPKKVDERVDPFAEKYKMKQTKML